MNKRLLIKLVLIFILTLGCLSIADAYTIDSTYKPDNLPFDDQQFIEDTGASGATIIILQILAGGLLYFAAPIAVVIIVTAAFTMVMNSGETDKVEQAKKYLTWAIAGLVLIILSYSLVRAVLTFIIQAAQV